MTEGNANLPRSTVFNPRQAKHIFNEETVRVGTKKKILPNHLEVDVSL